MRRIANINICGTMCLWLIVSFLFSTCQPTPDPDFYIYLCLGQSNMVGMDDATSADSVVSSRFLSLAATEGTDRTVGVWRQALPPLCSPRSGVSPVNSFGNTMLQHLPEDKRVGVIVVAVNGASILLFDPDQYQAYKKSITEKWMLREVENFGGNPYKRLVKLARKAQTEGVIKGILVHQGETDATDDVWIDNLRRVYQHLLNDLNLSATEVPLLVGEAVASDQQGAYQHVNTIIDRVHDFIPTAYTISSRGCEPLTDHLHFSREGANRLGQRYARKMLQLSGYPLPNEDEDQLQSASMSPLDAFVVNVSIRYSDSLLFVSSAEPLASVDITSFSGKRLVHLEPAGAQTVEIGLKTLHEERRFALSFKSMSGSVVNKHYDQTSDKSKE